jgi:hypothetical protein
MSATMAPRIEIYTVLACSVHKPDIFKQSFPGLELGLVEEPRQLPTHSSARLIGGIYPPHLTDKSGQATNASVPTKPNLCASDPVVQAAVAKLTAGAFFDLSCKPHIVLCYDVFLPSQNPYFTCLETRVTKIIG